ncbi:cysteine desulfurase family protein [Loigolactobacillus coryniformis]|jgi:cysteine desulfurase|uniref:Cysteine desulfurase n=4 Tax=Loigolactobacillus coryniformis TaxID=1610 RepID=A0A0R1F9T9_9LACO|nr:cysteine desulfurase family protein [Loigolactobacillus coryniformis]MDT3391343.1 cysteine desulfurase [Bacillota bacterium]OEH89740.1 cysteine desulfurase NifS [Loigolactobacillus coryniformis subsp. coryniformis]ATO43593.1 cysteine desulfurase NifS [Loigolactobacillus coryniformis subsp. torquens DSM 20004 = KCTC 3535]ATO55272.1 cysteine desulfurase NifS [Loigolactobacillus coryniformis subsp. coryniformis KCTC 3167 = DSM 20001]EJN56415.1 Putative cysteine desulfurase [Loigolactobacillus 
MTHTYLDNAATTPMDPAVIAVMTEQMQQNFGNASNIHYFGRQARQVLDASRKTLAQSINAKEAEIVFTSGGTEGDNTAIMQTALQRQKLGRHIITTAIEHEAVLKPLHFLETQGFEVTYLPVDERGLISLADFKAALRDDTILVSIMMGNNEVGSHMPIHEIGELLKDHQAWFHTDAVQAYGLLDIDVQRDHIDLLSVSAHKLNGPKFLGFLYRRQGINFPSFIKGGDQEDKRRAGTENIPAIAGFAKAVELDTPAEKAARQQKYAGFKHQLLAGLTANGIDFAVNGELNPDNLQHVLNIWIKGISTYVLQMNLDLAGFAISGGSACTAGSLEPSHVLTAMYGKDSPRIEESIRISFGKDNTAAEIDNFVAALTKIVQRVKKTVKI